MIEPEMVSTIYPKEVSKTTHSSTVKTLTFGPSFILIVKDTDVYELMIKIKGEMDKEGIRHKYCQKSK